ncbi:efflux RND transporter periplasmic adaptor subunit [Beijerinckia sp. L45]|uniref:efflux RND transporter periplasmic adaptor subunit n=1 Tax=Beijerinckia sp. L45 TaxID=1641855 RepID=UPI001AED92D2|nr:efflux RND transporter periplasmic adaptor subunit [Beijerinckia sp. L45]
MRGLLVLGTIGAVLAAAAWSGIASRLDAETALARVTDEAAVPTLATVVAQAGPREEEIVLPGNVQAEFETTIFARTSGYVKRWSADIGAKVKAGALLAEIDSPEVDQQLVQARAQLVQVQAALTQAQSNTELARVTNGRTTRLVGQGWSSEQQGDSDRLKYEASVAAVAVAKANVEAQQAQISRLEQLTGFERVTAPFDGVVTARQVDVGNLVNAGSGSGPELFRMADTRKLRIYVQVPQSYAALVKPGLGVDLRFPEYPGRTFPATLVRDANAIEPHSRTLLVELEANNANGELLPGGYTEVHFKLKTAGHTVRISANALLFRAEGPRIATADAEGRVSVHEVTIGRDLGTMVEVLTGIEPGDAVILNPPASIVSGARGRLQKDEKVDLRLSARECRAFGKDPH